jgi:hypothetical protein
MRWLITIVLLIFIGCSRPVITSNGGAGVNFNSYTTFCFADYDPEMPVARPDYNNSHNRQIIESAIIAELEHLGFRKVEQNSELMVQYDIIITEKFDPRVDSAVVYKPWVDVRTDTFNYTEGLLVIRLIDRVPEKLVWQGSITGILNRKPETFGKKIEKYLAELFSGLADQMQ